MGWLALRSGRRPLCAEGDAAVDGERPAGDLAGDPADCPADRRITIVSPPSTQRGRSRVGGDAGVAKRPEEADAGAGRVRGDQHEVALGQFTVGRPAARVRRDPDPGPVRPTPTPRSRAEARSCFKRSRCFDCCHRHGGEGFRAVRAARRCCANRDASFLSAQFQRALCCRVFQGAGHC
jgi:hypothetical protein